MGLVNIWDALLKAIGKHTYWYKTPFHIKRKNLWCWLATGTTKYASCKSSLTSRSFLQIKYLTLSKHSILKCSKRINWLSASRLKIWAILPGYFLWDDKLVTDKTILNRRGPLTMTPFFIRNSTPELEIVVISLSIIMWKWLDRDSNLGVFGWQPGPLIDDSPDTCHKHY